MAVRLRQRQSRPALPPAPGDARLRPPRWRADAPSKARLWVIRAFGLSGLVFAVWYFGWLLHPDRVGNPVLYALLVSAEAFNVVQAIGFWFTAANQVPAGTASVRPVRRRTQPPVVDVLIPTCGEPLHVVEPTIRAACAMHGADVRVHVLDDGPSQEVADLAASLGLNYVRRPDRRGAKAGSVNNALSRTTAPYVAVFDSDHVPQPGFLERCMPEFDDGRVAFVQTPQYYANGHDGGVASGAWAQQALFFGAIARGKDGMDAMFCCGTNVVFAREALQDIGGFPENSLTEDFELSLRIHERGWRTVYVPEVLASGVGPEDMASYIGQQQRWARGCLEALPRILRSRLPVRQRVQYGLSSMYFLSGWTFLLYMAFPVLRLLFGIQPVAAASADQFLLHFAPYYGAALGAVAFAGAGSYTFRGFALAFSSFWIHIQATLRALFRRPGGFVVTPKDGDTKPQPRAVLPALFVCGVLVASMLFGLAAGRDPGTLNNVAFAGMHVSVLVAGAWPALRPARRGTGDAS